MEADSEDPPRIVQEAARLAGMRGAAGSAERSPANSAILQDPFDGVRVMVGTITALQVALKIAVETNPRAGKLRDRFDEMREAAIARVIGEDVVDNVFDGIDYTMDELDELLPPVIAR